MNNTNDTKTGLASLPHYTNLQFNSLPGWARDLILALEQRAAAPALAASHAALVAALESTHEIMTRVYPNGLPIMPGTHCEEQDWDTAVRKAAAALSDARNLTAVPTERRAEG